MENNTGLSNRNELRSVDGKIVLGKYIDDIFENVGDDLEYQDVLYFDDYSDGKPEKIEKPGWIDCGKSVSG